MLGGFIERQRVMPPSERGDFRGAFAVLLNQVNFLRDPNQFPNQAVNKAVGLMADILGKEVFPVLPSMRTGLRRALKELSHGGELQAPVFMIALQEDRPTPYIILPEDYPKRVKSNPVWQLAVVAYMASQSRDCHHDRMLGQSEASNTRARAYEAEALLVLEKMAKEEKIRLDLSGISPNVLREFPEGLASLPPSLRY